MSNKYPDWATKVLPDEQWWIGDKEPKREKISCTPDGRPTTDIVLSVFGMHMEGDTRHAQEVMTDLGISYTHADVSSVFDAWGFYDCTNIPKRLPGFMGIAASLKD